MNTHVCLDTALFCENVSTVQVDKVNITEGTKGLALLDWNYRPSIKA